MISLTPPRRSNFVLVCLNPEPKVNDSLRCLGQILNLLGLLGQLESGTNV